MKGAIARIIQFEDVLLLIWLTVAEPWLFRIYGQALAAETGIWLGAFYVLACLLALIAYGTRSREEEAGDNATRMTPANYARLAVLGPFIFIGAVGFDLMGIEMGEMVFLILPGIVLALALGLYERLPRLPRLVRRLLMTPFVLVGAALFARFSTVMFGNFPPGALWEALLTPATNFIPLLLLFAISVYYLAFVFAPRQVADSRGSWWQWAVRYGLYLAALLFNLRLVLLF